MPEGLTGPPSPDVSNVRRPVEPPPCRWALPDPAEAQDGVEMLAVGGDLAPGTLLEAYRRGLFPMPASPPMRRRRESGTIAWWSPDPRGILAPGSVHESRSLRRSTPAFAVTVDTTFDEVVAACADPARPHGWITAAIRDAYSELHRLGWAHSVEVRNSGGDLVGGLYGVQIGGLFAGESMFHRVTDASKAAVVAAARMLADDGLDRLFDVQWATPHLASLGVVEVSRPDYLRRLATALTLPPALH